MRPDPVTHFAFGVAIGFFLVAAYVVHQANRRAQDDAWDRLVDAAYESSDVR